ncbi:hypothetical protein Bca52824_005792 [Brassica carinata]|uniref:Uncharacterized protein n=1 Tax=Brassica carinata TaxID=52824 RepID=A0A8X8BGJ8_BRACI|nr:hypothetical protein Bca52824_005792 [Brassica carinata]
MEMPGRRSNYTLLSQFPDDQVSVSVTGAPPPTMTPSPARTGAAAGATGKPRADSIGIRIAGLGTRTLPSRAAEAVEREQLRRELVIRGLLRACCGGE